jgi:hypothetical protein
MTTTRNSAQNTRDPRRQHRFFRPWLTVLEDRITPSTVTWDNDGGDYDWNNAANWSGDVLPGAADDVVIDFEANDFTVNLHGVSATIRSLVSEAGLSINMGSTLDRFCLPPPAEQC